mgnify:CR=1 FL=1
MIRFGILNGYVEDPKKEKRCAEYVWTTDKAYFWGNYFSGLKTEDERQKYYVKDIMAREISDRYAVILNPFGETYPEYSLDRRQVYNIIRNYIRNGGIFVNTAGFPFFYAWIVNLGRKAPVSEERLLLPTHFKIQGGTFSVEQLQMFIKFTGTLYYRDFGAVTTADTSLHSGAVPLKPFQTSQDKEKFGDLVSGLDEITEFRALREGVSACVPIVRATREEFGEVYPISGLKHGRGFLLVAAMGMGNEKECDLFAGAVDKFCDWVSLNYVSCHRE